MSISKTIMEETIRNAIITEVEKKTGIIFKMSWYKSKRHRISHTDMYFSEEKHTRLAYDDPLCKIEVIRVLKSSHEYTSAIENSQRENSREQCKTIQN